MNSAGRKITERVRRRRRNVIDILLRGSPMSGFLSPVSTLRGSEHAPGREINVLSTPARILQITPRTMIFARATAFSCPRHARQGGTAPLMVTRERKGRPRGAVARLLLVLALCGSALAQAQSVFKCVIDNPDGSRQTVFSATPCAAESEHLMVRASALSVRKVGRSDPGNEVAVLLASAERDTANALMRDATETLLRWQRATRPGALPPYDAVLLRQEMMLFPQWYLGRHRGIELSPEQATGLERVYALLIASAAAQPQVFVHRDYMPRNLMLSEPNPGVLDFQDAVIGPITYDIVSLLRDAFISWDEEQVLDWCIRYWEHARAAGLPVDSDFSEFFRAFEWMGLQRHLKVLGIFARLTHRDGKAKYVADTPRFLRYARAVAERYVPLASLARLLQRLEGDTARSVLSF